jgi:L-malate glycosyltransferase
MATRNRSRILRQVLEAYRQLKEPPSGWKLVVIDNGSTDETSEVIASFANRLPLCSVAEPRLGKNFALNSGLDLVEGDLVVFTDDDAFPRPDWLVQFRETADNKPTYSIFGGAIVPRWEVSPPDWTAWVPQGPMFSITDPARTDGVTGPKLVFGPNMAIRASIFQSRIRFDPFIGPKGSDYPMGSETELLLRLGQQGHEFWYIAGAVVEHLVREEQLKKDWVLRRAVRFGRGYYRMYYAPEIPKWKLWWGIPRHLYRDIPKYAIRSALAWLCLNQEVSFRSRWDVNFLSGQASEARRICRSKTLAAQSATSGEA